MIADNSLKTKDIRSKLVSFGSNRLTLQANHKNMDLSLENNILLTKKLRVSYLSPTEYDILDMIDNNSLTTQDIPSTFF